MPLNRVDDRRQHQREDHERPELDALRNGSGNDRGRRGYKDDLKKEIRHQAVPVSGRAFQKQATAQEVVACAVHEVVPHGEVGDAGQGVERDVLGQNRGHALGPDHAGFQHRKACGHPHHQAAADEQPNGIEDVFHFCGEFHVVAAVRVGGSGFAHLQPVFQQGVCLFINQHKILKLNNKT